MKVSVYNTEGTEVRTIDLPTQVFEVPWNPDLVHQVVIGMQANARAGRAGAHTKNRGEVRGGGKKPWRQKGTGRARHGSNRSPIWIGGGVTHGPRSEKDYSQRIPRKMRVKALYTALSQKLRDGEIVFIDSLSLSGPKTKDAKAFISSLGTIKGFETLAKKKTNSALIALSESSVAVKKSFQNFGNMGVETVRNLNAIDVLTYKYVIFVDPSAAMKLLEEKGKTKTKPQEQ